MLWFVRQSLVLLVLAWVLGLATGFLLFGRRRGWAEPVTDVIPVVADDEADADEGWGDEGWVAADAEADLPADAEPAPRWTPVGSDWDPVPAHHDYADPVWAAEAGITDDVLARQADGVTAPEPAEPRVDAQPPAPTVPITLVPPVASPVASPAASPVGSPVAPPVAVPRPSAPERVSEPRVVVPRYSPDGGDDLTRIDGVSDEIAAAFHASGLRSFTAVSRATTDDLRAALSAAGLAPTFKAAYWPLIAADLARAAADAEETAAAASEPPVVKAAAVAEPVAEPAAEPEAEPEAEETARPVTVDVTDAASAPVDVTEPAVSFALDDLEQIDGITLKIATALRDVGISTYTALAEAPHGQLRQALAAAGLRIAPTLQTWGAQARRLAAESDAALAARITAGGPGARL